MRTTLVVSADPPIDPLRVSEGAKRPDPDALLFEAADEALDHPVLLQGVDGMKRLAARNRPR
jgi:hypothetical protein